METSPKSPRGSSPKAVANRKRGTVRRRDKDPRKSRIANGSELLPGVDHRSLWVRRCRELIDMHVVDLAGEENTSTAERSIVRRAAVLSVELEQLERKFAAAGQADADDLDLYQRVSNTLRRLLEAVGLQRRSRDVTPETLDQIGAEIAAGREAETAEDGEAAALAPAKEAAET